MLKEHSLVPCLSNGEMCIFCSIMVTWLHKEDIPIRCSVGHTRKFALETQQHFTFFFDAGWNQTGVTAEDLQSPYVGSKTEALNDMVAQWLALLLCARRSMVRSVQVCFHVPPPIKTTYQVNHSVAFTNVLGIQNRIQFLVGIINYAKQHIDSHY